MQVEIGIGAVVAVAGLTVTLVGFVVAAAVKVSLAASEAALAAKSIERHADTQTEIRVVQARHAERLEVHTEEIGALRSKSHEQANTLARLAMRCEVEHGAE